MQRPCQPESRVSMIVVKCVYHVGCSQDRFAAKAGLEQRPQGVCHFDMRWFDHTGCRPRCYGKLTVAMTPCTSGQPTRARRSDVQRLRRFVSQFQRRNSRYSEAKCALANRPRVTIPFDSSISTRSRIGTGSLTTSPTQRCRITKLCIYGQEKAPPRP